MFYQSKVTIFSLFKPVRPHDAQRTGIADGGGNWKTSAWQLKFIIYSKIKKNSDVQKSSVRPNLR